MICPKCNSGLVQCVDSRPNKDYTRRRRVCVKCGERFSTVEITVEAYKTLQFKEYLLCDALAYSDKIKEKLKGNTKDENGSNG